MDLMERTNVIYSLSFLEALTQDKHWSSSYYTYLHMDNFGILNIEPPYWFV